MEKFVAPSQDTVDAVNVFLKENGLTAKTLSPAGDWLGFETTVGKANELFDTQFTVFKHDDSGRETVRTLAYSVPADLSEHIALVHPTLTYARYTISVYTVVNHDCAASPTLLVLVPPSPSH